MAVIGVSDLRKEFRVAGGVEVAVDGIGFEIAQGEFVTVVGPSGCGKTTTLRCIAGLETPTSGSVQFNGEEMTAVPPNKRNISMMFQDIALYPHMTVLENISYPLKVQGMPRDERTERSREAAGIVKIGELLEKYPGELSGGQRQRAALARTIVQDPVAFLMDEPLSDLDAKLKTEIRSEILRVHKRLEKPTLYVTHDQEEAMTMSDRIVVMNDGRIEQIDTPGGIYNDPSNVFVAEFMGNPSMNFTTGEVVERGDDVVRLAVFDQAIEVPRPLLQSVPDELTVGYRPQDFEQATGGSTLTIDGTLSLLEPIDNRALATIDHRDEEVRAVIPASAAVSVGEPIDIEISVEDLYFFDPATGDSLLTNTRRQYA